MPSTVDSHLLFGLLALQNGLIDPSKLLAAFQAWTLDRSKPLADHLVALGSLSDSQRTVLESLAKLHTEAHGGDLQKSLASIPVGPSTLHQLTTAMAAGDPDVEASLSTVGSASNADHDRTGPYHVGEATSEGQRFRVLRPHAKGGLGAVFVALDSELNREVALKQILDHHADHPINRKRFLIEAEITGGLEHPGIVPVYGLGTYGDGRPYYAMRFIRGDSLREVIDAYHKESKGKGAVGILAFRQLLKKFTDICNAIEYAHARGILHRDIKPGNVIVGKHGETLVVDWGLAKALGQSAHDADERTLIPSSGSGSAETLPGLAMGTPAYMSPEQARGDLAELGPRSDVYSLGATLYCLLTGVAPFDGQPAVILKKVEHAIFRRPRDQDSSIDPALEAIVLKAMAKSPDNRYESCRALADDIDRWLADERVLAHREPWARGLNRWLTKHRTAVTGAAAAGLMLMAGLAAIAAVQTRARRDLEVQRTRAEEGEQSAIDAVKRFRDVIANNPELKDNPSLESLRKALLKEPLAFFGGLRERLQANRDTRPESLVRLARIIEEYALLADEIGNKKDSLKAYEDSLTIWESLTRDDPDRDEYQDSLATILNCRGTMLNEFGGYAEALESQTRARDIQARLTGEHPEVIEYQAHLAKSHHNIGSIQNSMGRHAQALEAFERARDGFARLTVDHPDATEYQAGLAASVNNIGVILSITGRHAQALEAYERARDIRSRLAENYPDVIEYQSLLADSHNSIAILLSETGRHGQALEAYERARGIRARLAADHPAVTDYQARLAEGHNNIGYLLGQMGRHDHALEAFEQAREIRARLAEGHPEVTEYQAHLAESRNNIGNLLKAAGRPDQALETFERARDGFARLAVDHPDATEYQAGLAASHNNIGALLAETGRPAQALEAFERARDGFARLAGGYPAAIDFQARLADSHNNIGAVLDITGRPAQALEAFEQACDIRARLALDYPDVTEYQTRLADNHNSIGALLSETGRPGQALEAYERARGIRARLVEGYPDVIQYRADLATSHHNIGSLLSEMGRHDQALEAYERARDIRARLVEDYPDVIQYQDRLADSHHNIGILLSEMGRLDRALEASLRARDIRARLAQDHPELPDHASSLGGTLNNIARIEMSESRFPEARQRLIEAVYWQMKALNDNPHHPRYRRFLETHLSDRIQVARSLGLDDEAAEIAHELAEFRLSDPNFAPLDARLVAIRNGAAATDNAERLILAQRAYDIHRHAEAAKLWGEALEDDPKLADDRQAQHAYNAACAAALAADGQGIEPPADDEAKATLRGKALAWLRSEREAWAKVLESGHPQAKGVVSQTFRHWKEDVDLAGVRDRIDSLPEPERVAWNSLWADVEELLRRASGG